MVCIADMTARYKLSLDLHGFYKSTGLNRTYPNIINFEAVLFKDGINADKQAEDYKKELFTVTSASKRKIYMAPGGGFAMTINRK